MSDLTPSDDELISSYIDGEATLDEVARIQAEPALLARIQELEDATELLSTPVPPLPQADVDRLIDNALAQSSTSDRITDLSAVRASRIFNPQRLGTIAAAFLLLAGVVGALVALNNSRSGDEVASTSADSGDVSADDSFGDDGNDMAESDMAFDSDMAEDDLAEAMPETDDMSDMDDAGDYEDDSGDDMAESDDSLQATTTVAAVVGPEELEVATETAPTMSYRLINLEIAESYESRDELIDHTTEHWRELVDIGATQTTVPQTVEDQQAAEQTLANVPCAQRLSTFIESIDRTGGTGGISAGETTIADVPITIVIVELSIDTAELLAASEPNCAIEQLATLTP